MDQPSSSKHVLDIRAMGPQMGGNGQRQRIDLNYTQLLSLLGHRDRPASPEAPDDDDEIVEIRAEDFLNRGKKRSRSAENRAPPKKKAKIVTVVQSEDEDEEMVDVEEETELHLAFSHVFHFDLQKGTRPWVCATDQQARTFGWWREEAEFVNAVTERLGSKDEPGSVTLEEPVYLRLNRTMNRVYAFSQDEERSSFAKALFAVPEITQDGLDLEELDFSSNKHNNVLYSVMELVAAERVKLEAHLTIHSAPSADVPYSFEMSLQVFLIAPTILESVGDLGSTISESQRRLWYFLFYDQFDAPSPFEVDLPHFYKGLHPAPPIGSGLQAQLQPSGLSSTLLPFQRSSVYWMLNREGKTLGPDGLVRDLVYDKEQSPVPLFWTSVSAPAQSKSGKEVVGDWWIDILTGNISFDRPSDEEPVGGMLAEEPGLGKTVESIALVLYNTPLPKDLGPATWSTSAEVEVTPIKGTLIVTPGTLCKQWYDEIERHAPELRVLLYDGWNSSSVKTIISRSASKGAYKRALGRYGDKSVSKRRRRKRDDSDEDEDDEDEDEDGGDDGEEEDWRSFVGKFDIVLTTYNTLMKDLNVAKPPVKRPRREIAAYQPTEEKFRSPLILVEWQRVLMDEVQQVGNGKAAEMVSLIPRRSSFAVSGTPAKQAVKDLSAPLHFMGVPIGQRTWARLLKPAFYSSFFQIFDRYAIRTPKATAEGLNIPKQTRYTVPISLGMIERHFYDETMNNALTELGLDARGVPLYDDWELNPALLRSAIRRLRMACIHPQVGALGDRAGGPRVLGGAIRPIGDVLSSMVELNWQALVTDKKSLITARIQGALLQQRTQDGSRYKDSLEALQGARADILELIEQLNEVLAEHDKKGQLLIAEADARPAESDTIGVPDVPTDPKGKGKAKATPPDSEKSTPAPGDLLPASAEGDAHRHTRLAILGRIRDAQVVLHKIEFSMGDLYHHFGKQKEEDEAYERAEGLRRSLLKTTEETANRSIAKLNHDIMVAGVKEHQLVLTRASKPGIKSENLFEEVNTIMDVLEEQRVLLFKWRTHIYELLTQKIVSEGGSADGQEYQRALEIQGEIECYLKAYAALLADRREVLNQERTALAAHDDRERRLRHTKAAARAAAAFDDGIEAAAKLEAAEMEDPELTKALKAQRKECRDAHPTNRALRSVMIDLNKITGNEHEEAIGRMESKRLRTIIQEQTSLIDKMSNEQAPFRTTFNGRIAYFKQLQELSDSVADIELKDMGLQEAMEDNTEQIAKLLDSIRSKTARQRFLQYIARKTEAEHMAEEDRECGICNDSEFDTGFLLACGHLFCDECLTAWRKKGQGIGTCCPTCREDIDNTAIHRITFSKSATEQAEQLRKEEEELAGGGSVLRQIKYNVIPSKTLEELGKVESVGRDYGEKIHTLIRHLLLIEEADSGAKSIVFSAWADSLHIIEHGLRANGIPCIRVDANSGKRNAAHQFQTDPSIRVILLHGERENSGLNLTCAKRIMLVEPTVNSSFEVQAIARVDRLGQKEETEVYCYYADDSVEQNILDVAARKGTSLYTVDNAATSVNLGAATTLEQQKVEGASKDKKLLKGDFIAGAEQMLEVLFPEHFIDIEDIVMQDVIPVEDKPHSMDGVAGPSHS